MHSDKRDEQLQRYVRGELSEDEAHEMALDVVTWPDAPERVARAFMGDSSEASTTPPPRVLTHVFQELSHLTALTPEALAWAATSAGQHAAKEVETMSGDGLQAVAQIEGAELVVHVVDDSQRPLAGAMVSLRLVEGSGRSERRAHGATDDRGRVSLGRIAFFTPPLEASFYHLSVVAPDLGHG